MSVIITTGVYFKYCVLLILLLDWIKKTSLQFQLHKKQIKVIKCGMIFRTRNKYQISAGRYIFLINYNTNTHPSIGHSVCVQDIRKSCKRTLSKVITRDFLVQTFYKGIPNILHVSFIWVLLYILVKYENKLKFKQFSPKSIRYP